LGEQGDGRGLKHGFATWNGYLKRNDFIEYALAKSCLVGYEKDSSGKFPTRHCDQVGEWQNGAALPPITNACVRKKCREQIKGVNLSLTRGQDWFENGGAEFTKAGNAGKELIASRHHDNSDPNEVPDESIFYGDCRGDLGFYQLDDPRPSRACRYDGEWAPVKNQCVTDCGVITVNDAIESADTENPTHGFALWPEVKSVSSGKSKEVTGKCLNQKNVTEVHPYNYINNPYDVDESGNVIIDADGDPSYNLDTDGKNQPPTRECSYFDGGGNTAWTKVKNPCINKCSSITQKVDTSGGKVAVTWKQTLLGEYDYHLSDGCRSGATNAESFDGNGAGCYYLKRKCNNDGTWGSVVPMCAANNGRVGNATYFAGINTATESQQTGVPGVEYIDAVEVGDYLTSNSCSPNHGNSGIWPTRQCSYEPGNQNVDRLSFNIITSGTDCLRSCNQNFTETPYTGSYTNALEGNVMTLNCSGGKVKRGNPRATCSNGQWTKNLVDTNNRCRDPYGCSASSIKKPHFYGFASDGGSYLYWSRNDNKCSLQSFKHSDYTFTDKGHGESSIVCKYSTVRHGGKCGGAGYLNFTHSKLTASCSDGDYTITETSGFTACDGTGGSGAPNIEGAVPPYSIYNLFHDITDRPTGSHIPHFYR
jgi:hypothetical protein